jgi:hypothetical protein
MAQETVREYEEYTVVWDGAQDEKWVARLDGTFIGDAPDNALTVDAWLEALSHDAIASDAHVEVYLLSHPHEFGIDCECVQYAQDHRPAFTFGPDADDE